jgi:hypothetical protein
MQLYLTEDPVMVLSSHPPYNYGRDRPIVNPKMLFKAYPSRSCSTSVYLLGEEHVPPPAVLPQIESPTRSQFAIHNVVPIANNHDDAKGDPSNSIRSSDVTNSQTPIDIPTIDS